MDSCIVLLAYVCLAAWRTLLKQLLACQIFTLDSEDLFDWFKWKKCFLWPMSAVQKPLKTMEMIEFDLILLIRDLYFNFNLKTLTDFINCSRRTEFKDILPWNISQMQCCKLKLVTYNYCSYSSFYWPFFCDDTEFNICFDFENLW